MTKKERVSNNEWTRLKKRCNTRYHLITFDPVIMAEYYDRMMPTFKNNPTMSDPKLMNLALENGLQVPTAGNTHGQQENRRRMLQEIRSGLMVHWVVMQILDPIQAEKKAQRDPQFWLRYRVLFALREIEETARDMALEHPNDIKYQEILANIVNKGLASLPGKGGKPKAPEKMTKENRLKALEKQRQLLMDQRPKGAEA